MSDHDRVEIVFRHATGSGIRIDAIRAGQTFRNQGRAANASHLIAALAGHVRPSDCAPDDLIEGSGFHPVAGLNPNLRRYRLAQTGGVYELTLSAEAIGLEWIPVTEGQAGSASELLHLDRSASACWPSDLERDLDHAAIALRIAALHADALRAAA